MMFYCPETPEMKYNVPVFLQLNYRALVYGFYVLHHILLEFVYILL